jgi:hypothetical protein
VNYIGDIIVDKPATMARFLHYNAYSAPLGSQMGRTLTLACPRRIAGGQLVAFCQGSGTLRFGVGFDRGVGLGRTELSLAAFARGNGVGGPLAS